MRCDFATNGSIKYCIRCGMQVAKSLNYRTCERMGLGDRLFWLTQAMGIKSCESCVDRRMKLNELDRRIYRRFYRCRLSDE